MAVTDYASIRTELNLHTTRSYSQGQVDTFIGLFEGDANLHLGPNYTREVTATINTDASGVGALPSGFVRFISLVHATAGPLTLTTSDEIARCNPLEQGGVPNQCAIKGTNFITAPVFDGDLDLTYEGTLSTLVAGANTTNWLLARAPQAYFWGVVGQAAAFEENWQVAAAMDARAMSIIDKLDQQTMIGQYGRARLKPRGATP